MTRYLLPLLLLASPVYAEEDTCKLLCGPLDSVHRGLTAAGERVTAQGVTGGGSLITIYSTRDGSTWTVLLVLPSGDACALAAGIGWERILGDSF